MALVTRVFPHPFLTLLLAAVWCMLTNSVGLGDILFGLLLGIVLPAITAVYWPGRPRFRKPLKLFGYIGLVIWDIIIANVAVAWIVLTKRNDSMKSTWIAVPLDLKTPEAITILAGTITLTPGTVSADLSNKGNCLLVHALDESDPEAAATQIKSRYERRLKEIFE